MDKDQLALLLTILGLIADVIGIVGAVFAFKAWRAARWLQREREKEQERLLQPIRVLMTNGSQVRKLPVHLQRGELSRAELLGRIGMIPMRKPGQRFSIACLSTVDFLETLSRVQRDSTESELLLPCTAEEFEQFDLPPDGIFQATAPAPVAAST